MKEICSLVLQIRMKLPQVFDSNLVIKSDPGLYLTRRGPEAIRGQFTMQKANIQLFKIREIFFFVETLFQPGRYWIPAGRGS